MMMMMIIIIYICLQIFSSIACLVWKPAKFEVQSCGGASPWSCDRVCRKIYTYLMIFSLFRSSSIRKSAWVNVCCSSDNLGSLGKPRWRRQRERHWTKGLTSKTIAAHVCYESLYISLPSSAKQEREMTKFCVVYGTLTTTANFWYFHLKLNAVVAYLA